jgi:hypothetical protein
LEEFSSFSSGWNSRHSAAEAAAAKEPRVCAAADKISAARLETDVNGDKAHERPFDVS